jgi:PPK2 family polyphosphate:nucleotide phosphotransferase
MKENEVIKRSRKFAEPYCVTNGAKFRLKDCDPADTGKATLEDKPKAKELLETGIQVLAELQDVLYAQDRWSLLLIFQAMDAAGKDGVIKHVMSGLNPQGCQVYSFKSPSAEDLNHDYLWRCMKCLPERGRIGIFNRSYYEETLAVRVHPELLANQKVPQELVTREIWEERFHDIRHFERYLARNGVVVRKFFLYISAEEQKNRFLERLNNPAKNWKFSSADSRERGFWKEYMDAYQDLICNTATDYAPWYVVPADNKWYTRVVVAAAVIDALESMNLRYPEVTESHRKELAAAKEALIADRKL